MREPKVEKRTAHFNFYSTTHATITTPFKQATLDLDKVKDNVINLITLKIEKLDKQQFYADVDLLDGKYSISVNAFIRRDWPETIDTIEAGKEKTIRVNLVVE